MIDIDLNGMEEASFYFREDAIENSSIDSHHALVPSLASSVKAPLLRRTNSSSSSVLFAELWLPPTLETSSGSSSSDTTTSSSSSSESSSLSESGSHNLVVFSNLSPMSAHEFSAFPSTTKKNINQQEGVAGSIKPETKHDPSIRRFWDDATLDNEGTHQHRHDIYDGCSACSSDTVESLDYSIPSLLEEEEERQILKNEGDLRHHRVVFLRGVNGCASAVLVPIKDNNAAGMQEEPELEDEPELKPLFHSSREIFHSSQELSHSSQELSNSSQEESETETESSYEDSRDSSGNECCFLHLPPTLTLIFSQLFGKKETPLLPKDEEDDVPKQRRLASTTPLFHHARPLVQRSGPFVPSSGPFFQPVGRPVFQPSSPVFQTTDPVFQSSIPVFQTTDPVFQSTSPVFQTSSSPGFQQGGASFQAGRSTFRSGGALYHSARPPARHTGHSSRQTSRRYSRQSFR